MSASYTYPRPYRARAAALFIALGAAATFTTPTLANDPVPAQYDGSNVDFNILPGSLLRTADSLLSSVSATVKGGTIRGNGVCTSSSCPVVYEGKNLFARRSRLTLPDGVMAPRASTDNKPASAAAKAVGAVRNEITKVTGAGGIDHTLRRGDQGPDVLRLQEALNRNGAALNIDKNYGRGTRSAVEAFQKAKGLKTDGTAGPETLRALGL